MSQYSKRLLGISLETEALRVVRAGSAEHCATTSSRGGHLPLTVEVCQVRLLGTQTERRGFLSGGHVSAGGGERLEKDFSRSCAVHVGKWQARRVGRPDYGLLLFSLAFT